MRLFRSGALAFCCVLAGLWGTTSARAATLPFDIPLVATGAGQIGANWISLPNATQIKTAEELCDAIGPNATSVAQVFPDAGRRYTWSCAGGAGACTTTNPAGTIPEPGCSASSCFCIDDGEGYEVKVSAATTLHVDGCESPVPIALPAGGRNYLASVPFATALVTWNDLALAAGLQATGLVRGTVTGLDPAIGVFNTCQAGSPACMALPLVPGRAYRLSYTVDPPAPYTSPTTSAGPCVDFDINLVATGDGMIGTNWISLPTTTPIKTAEDLCAVIGPTATSVTQVFPDVSRRYTWSCSPGFCATTNPAGTLREPGCTTSSCFCIDDGEAYEIKVSADTPLHIAGCESPVPITLPAGGRNYLASVPFATALVTWNDLALAVGLQSTGLVRGVVTGIDPAAGAFNTCQAGSSACMTLPLVPGRGYRLGYTIDGPPPYANPTTRVAPCFTCGNATIEAFDEECDDGNLLDGDCCSSVCQSGCGCGQVCGADGMTCEDLPIRVAGVADPVNATAVNRVTGEMSIAFGPACQATDHTIYWGNLVRPWDGTYKGQACHIGCSGLATFSPGGGSIFFFVVPDDGIDEGSYGLDSTGAEVPEAVGLMSCDYPQDLSNTCP
jgi:hypothetical protein